MGTAGNADNIETRNLAKAMEQVARKQNRGKFTRRALIGAAGLGVCAGAVVAAPIAIQKAGTYTQQELDQALQNGIAQGRQELLAELRSLEGIGLDTAIAIAKVTQFAVQNIVKPLADLSSALGSDVIGALILGVAQARGILSSIPGTGGAQSTLGHLETLLRTWQHNVSKDVLGQYAVEDVTAAEKYLEALQQKING